MCNCFAFYTLVLCLEAVAPHSDHGPCLRDEWQGRIVRMQHREGVKFIACRHHHDDFSYSFMHRLI